MRVGASKDGMSSNCQWGGSFHLMSDGDVWQDPFQRIVAKGHRAINATWVDDVMQQSEGARRALVRALGEASTTFIERCCRGALGVAPKFPILASDPRVAQESQAIFKSAGVSVVINLAAADLGHRPR